MSLTTAVSDDDDGESVINSPYRGKQTGTAAASFNCTGAVRKAGYVTVVLILRPLKITNLEGLYKYPSYNVTINTMTAGARDILPRFSRFETFCFVMGRPSIYDESTVNVINVGLYHFAIYKLRLKYPAVT